MDFQYTGTDTLEIMAEAKNYNHFLEKLVLKYIPENDSIILDIGAGIGTFAKKLSLKHIIHCIEPDLVQSRQIEKLGLPVNTSIEAIRDDSVDYIYALNVLEHIENDREELKNWTKKLKPGGQIFIYVPAYNILYSSFDKSVGHYRRYRKNILINIFKEANLHIKEARYADSLGFFVSLLYKSINKGDGKISKFSLKLYDKLFPVSRFLDFFLNRLFGKNVYCVGKRI
jgi:predicted SAM-dependent methyltransferase